LATLWNFDLKLLVAFDALMTERSVSRAAERIGITQPSLSYTLKRLRVLFSDELLVRTAKGMQPTPRALALYQPVSAALEQLQAIATIYDPFDPATVKRTFHLAMPDSLSLELAPAIIRRVHEIAPNVDLHIANSGPADAINLMTAGDVELALGYFPRLPQGFANRLLFADRLVCVVDHNNSRLRDGRLDLDSYLASEHVTVAPDRGSEVERGYVLRRTAARYRIVAVVPHYNSIPAVVQGTELVGHMRERMVATISHPENFAFFVPPIDVPSMTITQVWHERSDGDAGHRWLRNLILQSAEAMPAPAVAPTAKPLPKSTLGRPL
jgi:LysR family transcriptional activator of mexEF-oprN operon